MMHLIYSNDHVQYIIYILCFCCVATFADTKLYNTCDCNCMRAFDVAIPVHAHHAEY